MTQAQFHSEEKIRLRKQLVEQAIKLALQSQWEEAVATNRTLLSQFPRDPEALNRLGKALSELGQYAEAKKAYAEALEINPSNAIARKNLERLSHLGNEASNHTPPATAERIDPRLFIEETGKTGFTRLVNIAPPEELAKLTSGDQVYFHVDGRTLHVRNARGEDIGQVEPRLANRLINFMEGGNQYAAAITDLNDHEVRVIVRETYQHPNMLGRVTFPAQGAGETIRPYIKDSVLRYDRDEEEDFGEDGDYSGEGDNEPEDIPEIEFEESDSSDME
ncbi:MAG TPA: tetratricopeptide repeat protein [Ktedonobacterales bacterium]|nr:tetratricopeptide repeat protein [Ktedonobacterales bacterium]